MLLDVYTLMRINICLIASHNKIYLRKIFSISVYKTEIGIVGINRRDNLKKHKTYESDSHISERRIIKKVERWKRKTI